MMISILTLFPEMFQGPFGHSILKRGQEKGLLRINLINIRDFATDKHKSVDDRPYGGGQGMIMRVGVVVKAIEYARKLPIAPAPEQVRFGAGNDQLPIKSQIQNPKSQTETTENAPVNHPEGEQRKQSSITNIKKNSGIKSNNNDWEHPQGVDETSVVLLSPTGKTFNQSMAREYAKIEHLILVCGHYEGFDARIEKFVDEVVSVGDYVLTGGEIPAMAITDAVSRLLPGVLEKPESIREESFSEPGTLEYSQYTRPRVFRNLAVPEVLLSGDHKEIRKWRAKNQKSK